MCTSKNISHENWRICVWNINSCMMCLCIMQLNKTKLTSQAVLAPNQNRFNPHLYFLSGALGAKCNTCSSFQVLWCKVQHLYFQVFLVQSATLVLSGALVQVQVQVQVLHLYFLLGALVQIATFVLPFRCFGCKEQHLYFLSGALVHSLKPSTPFQGDLGQIRNPSTPF